MIYSVELTHKADGRREISRNFDRIGQARRWAKWLLTLHFVAASRILQGGPGGMEVK